MLCHRDPCSRGQQTVFFSLRWTWRGSTPPACYRFFSLTYSRPNAAEGGKHFKHHFMLCYLAFFDINIYLLNHWLPYFPAPPPPADSKSVSQAHIYMQNAIQRLHHKLLSVHTTFFKIKINKPSDASDCRDTTQGAQNLEVPYYLIFTWLNS